MPPEVASAHKVLGEELESLITSSELPVFDGLDQFHVTIVSPNHLIIDGGVCWLDDDAKWGVAPFQAVLRTANGVLSMHAFRYGRQDEAGNLEHSPTLWQGAVTKWYFEVERTRVQDRRGELELSLECLLEVARFAREAANKEPTSARIDLSFQTDQGLGRTLKSLFCSASDDRLRASDGQIHTAIERRGADLLIVRGSMYCLLTGAGPFELELRYAGDCLVGWHLRYGRKPAAGQTKYSIKEADALWPGDFPPPWQWWLTAENDVPLEFRQQ